MEKEVFLRKYWGYYLLLEEKVIELHKYIEFEEDNFKVYSFEIQSRLVMICCEIETVYKLIVGGARNNAKEYIEEIMCKSEYKQIINDEVVMIDYGRISLKPVESACNKDHNGWWDSYNSFKHSKIENDNYKNANLRNVLNALATLYLLEIRYYNNSYFKIKKVM